ncbi:pro-sigmaK processing inhibitor BofA family protein [Bacillus sp. L381]|uniref:pro-sigmaK processing inhibitor BofA family protein n=1 Tax=Bacillus TaxID=1386 RepID=UPI0008266C6F|nr:MULTISPECIES: pro-sigmaK processing inhibitor BofA family protein [Bacillus]AOC89573.1 Sigma-K factor-processing regulatory protein BofA [Bacillus amyloliquefaciens]MCR9041175.1 pro-sigmaK processing inhibitor BofA family protein [Bacillus velezensis]QUN09677.1 pro-sigmaK processing inhibitor BofA family protein [Bacillus amyloliquefaciens]QYM82752.1 pro-sigmaK processing inhibitor BofA family protein [Bacillus sp. 7D3]QZY11987.1 pro-sigmaK processing inhibitor BofA family protein [Bacillus
MEPFFIIGLIVGLVALLFLWGVSPKPLRWIGLTAIKFIAGAILLVGVNLFGGSLGIHIPVNLVTTGVSGILGIPGIAALIVIKRFII